MKQASRGGILFGVLQSSPAHGGFRHRGLRLSIWFDTRQVLTAKEVGLFDAKTHLSALIDRVGQGEEITITKRGAAVARLVPPDGPHHRQPAEAAARIRELRRGLNLRGTIIRSLIEAGCL